MRNTNCNLCFFYKNKQCEWDIHTHIKNVKDISYGDNETVISNYTCRYCMSEENARTYIEKSSEEDLRKAIIDNSKVPYVLYLLTDNLSSLKEICNYVHNMTIKPKRFGIVYYGTNHEQRSDYSTIMQEAEKRTPECEWYIHEINSAIQDKQEMIHTLDDTREKRQNYIMIKENNLENLEQDILNIDYQINILQDKPIGIMGMNELKMQSLDGLFMSSFVWKHHMKTVDVTKISLYVEEEDAPYHCYRHEN